MLVLVSQSALAFNGKGERLREQFRHRGIKNVIVMIPDGCDETVQTVARWYKGEDLQVDKMAIGAVKIHMADSIITDSASAATAFASAIKTSNGYLGVGPDPDTLLSIYSPEDMATPYAPVATVLEAAKLSGKATGVVATSRITHATPAAFYTHVESRNWPNDIMEHLVYNDVDVVFGGGKRHLLLTSDGGKRSDEDLMSVLLERGYTFVETADDMDRVYRGKVFGLFDLSHMQPDIDRQYFAPQQPSLAEMTQKAIDLLSRDKDGFFLMVEGSQVDWAGHNNDPIYMVTDFIAFDDAVKVACDFADRDGRTLIMAFPDHNTGGMKIGHYNTAVGYTETKVGDLVDPLKGMKISSPGLVAMLENDSDAELIAKVAEYWSLDIVQADVDEIRELQPEVGLAYALARVLSKNYTVIGWTTHGHNGETVPLWIHGMDAPVGTIDNTDLALMAAEAMNVDLDATTSALYVDLAAFTSDYVIEGDPTNTDGYGMVENSVVKIKGAELPISKDYMIYKGRTIRLPGVTVYAPHSEKVYLSQKALNILRLK
jgi:alkaline phosphatase